ncbi:MAG: hypothetical protein Q9227_006497 [Pyrenula ochraceoflavens]
MKYTSLYQQGLEDFMSGVAEHLRTPKDKDVYETFLLSFGTPEKALKDARRLKDTVDGKYGGNSVEDKNKIETRLISSIMSNIQSFIHFGDLAMKKAPESVGMAWFAVSLALTAIQNNYALYSLFGASLADIRDDGTYQYL